MNIESYQKFNQQWGDAESYEAVKETFPKANRSILIEQSLTSFSNAFRNPLKPPQVKEYSKSLENTGVDLNELESIFSGLKEESEQMPSLAHLLYKIRSRKPIVQKTTLFGESSEDRLVLDLKAKFLEVMEQSMLDKMVKIYMNQVWPEINLEAYGLSGILYERCVLIDWKDSGFKGGKEIIEMALKKREKQLSSR
jgi:hypothetical protein